MADNTVTTYNGHHESAAQFNDWVASSKDDIFDLYDATIEMILSESA